MLSFVRVLFAFFVIFFIAITAYAQNHYPKNELEFGYGIFPSQELIATNGNFFSRGISGEQLEKTTGTGSLSFAYNCYVTQRLAMGVTIIYDKVTAGYKDVEPRLNWNVFALMVNTKYNYVLDPRFHMYSGLSAGYAGDWAREGTDTKRNSALAFQLRLVGMRFGSDFSGFAEMGYGYEGVLRAGLSLQF